jgi:CRP-like cAMP-binding protein
MTENGNRVHLAAAVLARSLVRNRSAGEGRSRFVVPVRLPAEVPPARCLRILQNALRAVAEGSKALPIEKNYDVAIRELDGEGVLYHVYFWMNPGKHKVGPVRHAVCQRVLDHLRLAGVPLAPTSRAVSSRLNDGLAPLELLSSLDLFAGLSESRLREIAGRLEPLRLLPGQRVLRQGDTTTEMYFIAEGLVRVTVLGRDGAEVPLTVLEPGDYFGEMSLLTNEPRTATIHALTEGAAFFLSRPSMQEVVETNPEILKTLSSNLAVRRLERDTSLLKANTGERPKEADRGAEVRGEILEKMGKVFFEITPDPNVPLPPS